MSHIVATQTAFPENYCTQSEIIASMGELCRRQAQEAELPKITRLFEAVGVRGRHLCLPLVEYLEPRSFGARNDLYLKHAVDLGERAIRELLSRAELAPGEVRLLVTTTVTGLAVPSLDARLMNRIGFRPDLKRTPLFGLGCVGGAAGIARVHDYLRGHPDEAAVLLSVELCSLTQQASDMSTANVIASGLFGDGAAAVLMVGAKHRLAHGRKPRVVASRSAFFPETERVMGWDVVDSGMKIVLGKGVPELARTALPTVIGEFLRDHGLAIPDVAAWIAHPGGPAVIDGVQHALGLPDSALAVTRGSLANIGNLSSSSVLVVLQETLQGRKFATGDRALLFAMGPGFCAELVLLSW
jgi:alkylresorcinol/alkylpyrone synthase